MRSTSTIVLLATPLLLAAQQGTDHAPGTHLKQPFSTAHPTAEQGAGERSDATALWSEDFGSGLNGWSVVTSVGQVDWVLTSTGNTDGYTPGPLESTTGYPDGQWIVADSDAGGTDGQPENTAITSPPIIGFDTIPLMLLRFEQSFRQLNDDQTLVEVSGNGGEDWTTYPVNQAISGNQSTPGAPASELITLNISSALALGSGDIRLRFRWISEQGFTYSWQVDDIALLPVRPNDLVLHEATWASWNLDEPGYAGIPCTIYPLGETHELKFRGLIGNNGSETQTDVHLRVEITGPDGYELTLTSPSIDLAPGSADSLFILDYDPPDVVGDYAFHISAVQDQVDDVPDDNSLEQGIRVDEHVFARDEGELTSQRDNNGHDYELGNRFWIEEHGRMLEAVEVALGPGTEVGSVISATVYDGYFDYVGQSDLHVVTQQEINPIGGSTFITLPLFEPTELVGERLYLVCVHAQVSDGDVFTGLSGSSLPQTSMLYRHDSNQWYYVTSTPMVRMRLDDFTGISDRYAEGVSLQAYPSPFEAEASVRFHTEHAEELSWELRDATGRLCRSANLGRKPPGEHLIRVDGGGLAEGIYTMTVLVADVRSTIKLVHQARR